MEQRVLASLGEQGDICLRAAKEEPTHGAQRHLAAQVGFFAARVRAAALGA